ncbi:hypothetical protein BS50DRAFT_648668 [Corynespora cassiicola Philippines]|uniref:TPR-like protein n=1 Tax=Corynespora cassiicola Philippines TaxID=1448308 RepID=A0A2T2NCT4_CORCC|nr:hypothetical protein BS50DRAFT_648668 [Corynespora cassiicola Philippines]
MPPKRKTDFLKPKPKAKGKAPEPQSEDDFLDVADEFERSAGKWRAGDAAKAARFFNRAIDMYNEGLKQYPKSFDLAYNKANLEYNITEDERIVSHFGSRIALLEETLQSHRFATTLNSDNIDVLFNTAQVLTSLAEAILEAQGHAISRIPARALLEEAVDIFTKCLDSQQNEYEQMQAEIAKAQASEAYQDDSEDAQKRASQSSTVQEDMETESTASSGAGEWAHVVEPVTPETLLETCTAQLGALTTLLGLYDPSELANMEKRAQSGLETATTKIPTLIDLVKDSPFSKPAPTAGPTLSIAPSSSTPADEDSSSPKADALLAAAAFRASIAEATFRTGQSQPQTYLSTLEQIFQPLTSPQPSGVAPVVEPSNAHSAYADALMELASAIADTPSYPSHGPSAPQDLDTQWTALSRAQTILTALASPPAAASLAPERLADVFLARGDVDLFRFRIGGFEGAKPAWAGSRAVLVANAGVFYRGARSYAERAGVMGVRGTADAKAIVAEVIKEAFAGSGERKAHWKGRGGDMARAVEEMVAEGIVGVGDMEKVVGFTA